MADRYSNTTISLVRSSSPLPALSSAPHHRRRRSRRLRAWCPLGSPLATAFAVLLSFPASGNVGALVSFPHTGQSLANQRRHFPRSVVHSPLLVSRPSRRGYPANAMGRPHHFQFVYKKADSLFPADPERTRIPYEYDRSRLALVLHDPHGLFLLPAYQFSRRASPSDPPQVPRIPLWPRRLVLHRGCHPQHLCDCFVKLLSSHHSHSVGHSTAHAAPSRGCTVVRTGGGFKLLK